MGHHLIQDTKSGDVFCAYLDDDGTINAISDAWHWSDWQGEDGLIRPDFDPMEECESGNVEDNFVQFEYRVLA